jgi:hypothetical protein
VAPPLLRSDEPGDPSLSAITYRAAELFVDPLLRVRRFETGAGKGAHGVARRISLVELTMDNRGRDASEQ